MDFNTKLAIFHNNNLLFDDQLETSILEEIYGMSKEYIFTGEQIRLTKRKLAKEIECLYSVINIGDNLNDEWFIAKIALELSKNFPVTISVWDNHGQFMAIEAIDHFPVQDDYDEIENDLESDIENRIFLYKGEIRFIPLNIKVPNKLNKAIKVFWKVVSEDNQQTFLPEIFNKTVMKKINFNFKADRHFI